MLFSMLPKLQEVITWVEIKKNIPVYLSPKMLIFPTIRNLFLIKKNIPIYLSPKMLSFPTIRNLFLTNFNFGNR